MKISLITASYNSEKYIGETLQSVADQTYDNIEHVLIDGKSKDRSCEIIQSFAHVAKFVSEPDQGIYDALNKGTNYATGDVIGFVHSDDYLHSNTVIEEIANYFQKHPEISAVYGDIVFVNDDKKILRYYSSKDWTIEKMKIGKMPAHPSFFARTEVYEEYQFDLRYRIAADFDHILRVAKDPEFQIHYIPLITTSMRMGGASTDGIKSNLRINKEILQICSANGLKTNYLKIYSKYPSRILEFVHGRLGF